MFNLPIKIAVFLGAVLITITGVYFYGTHQYSKGFDQANLEASARAEKISEEYRKKEQDWAKQAQEKDDAAQKAKFETKSATDKLVVSNNSLRNTIAEYKRRISEATTDPKGTPDKGETGIDLFGECSERYGQLAKETARLADKTNAIIDRLAIGQ